MKTILNKILVTALALLFAVSTVPALALEDGEIAFTDETAEAVSQADNAAGESEEAVLQTESDADEVVLADESEADETADMSDDDTVTLFDGEAEVKKHYDGFDNIELKDGGKFGLTFENNFIGVPMKAEDDAVFKYGGTADPKGWNLKQISHGQNSFVLDKAALTGIKTKKLIIELDVLPMYDGNGISLRYTPNGVSGTETPGNIMLLGGKRLRTGMWNKVSYVLGNTSSDKSYEIYINGELDKSGNMSGYGTTGTNVKIYPHANDGSPIETYTDNIKIIAADSFEAHSEKATVSSADESIEVNDTTISAIEYGTTVNELSGKLTTDGTAIFVGGADYRNVDGEYIIENGCKVAAVSQYGLYSYYDTAVRYMPGDTHKKVIIKRHGPSDATLKNLGDIQNTAALVYDREEGSVNGKVYVRYLDGTREEIPVTIDEQASANDNIKALLIDSPENFATSTPVDGSDISIDLAVESGVTVSGTASAGTPVTLFILTADGALDSSQLQKDGEIENIYYVGGTDAKEDGSFSFDTVAFKSSGTYKYFIYKDGALYTKDMFAPGKQAVKDFKEAVVKIEDGGDLKDILDADSVTGDMGLVYDYYNELTNDEKLAVCTDIAEAMNLYDTENISLDDFADNLKYRTMIPAMVKETENNPNPENTVYKLLNVDNKIFALSGSAADKYRTMSDKDKQSVCGYISNNDKLPNPAALQGALDTAVINTELDTILTHSDVYNILKAHSDILPELDLTKYGKLTSKKQGVNMSIYNARPYDDTTAVATEANGFITKAYKDEKENGGGGSPSPSRKNTGSTVSSSEPFTPPNANVPDAGVFSDIKDVEWAQEAINVLNKKGIVSGKGGKVFDPNGNVKREEFVKMIVEAAGLTQYKTSAEFTDVGADDWFGKYVSIAAENGITKGMGDGRFGVGENITRQDMMVMCMYLIPEGVKGGKISGYSDSADVAEYAVNAVATLTDLGIVNGDGGKISPNENCTRAQAAKVIYMILKYNNKN